MGTCSKCSSMTRTEPRRFYMDLPWTMFSLCRSLGSLPPSPCLFCLVRKPCCALDEYSLSPIKLEGKFSRRNFLEKTRKAFWTLCFPLVFWKGKLSS